MEWIPACARMTDAQRSPFAKSGCAGMTGGESGLSESGDYGVADCFRVGAAAEVGGDGLA